MAAYNYIAIDGKSGKECKGTVEAASEELAAADLKKRNFYPTSIKPAKAASPARSKQRAKGGFNMNISLGGAVIKRKELTIVTRQLAILLDAGLPLIRSLRTLEQQTTNPSTKIVLGKTADLVEGGSTFSEALAQNPKSFDKLYLNMVRAGEASGSMESILDRLAMFMEKAAGIAGKVKSALVYPIAVLFIAVTITSALMIFIVPNFANMFNEMLEGRELPKLTQFLIWLSEMMRDRFYVFVIGIAGVIGLFKLIKRNHFGKYALNWIVYNMPLFGPVVAKTAISRFSQTLGTLMASGVPILNALRIVRDTAGNEVVARAIDKVEQAVKEGEGIARPLAATGVFPTMVISMIEVGEETGRLPDMLEKISGTYEREVDNAVRGLTSLIEPILIVSLAVVVGGIVVAMFLPIVTLIDNL